MAQLNKSDFAAKYGANTGGAAVFKDNTTGDIGADDMRSLGTDAKDSAMFLSDNFIDEDDMASDSDTKAPSQQSVKAYVDARTGTTVSSSSWKDPCVVATTVNITLSGEQTIDGVLTSGSRVLVKNQTDESENGIYVSAAGAWSRATDADDASELEGAAVSVEQGTVGANLIYIQTSDSIVLETTDIVWEESNSIPDASATIRGLVSTGAQNFAGAKTFQNNVIINVSDGLEPNLMFRDGGSMTSGEFWNLFKSSSHALTFYNGSNRFSISAAGVITIHTAPSTDNTNTTVLSRDSSTGNIEQMAVVSTSYTPLLSPSTNISTVGTPMKVMYTRVGNFVTVYGTVTADPIAAGSAIFEVALPVSSTFTNINDCAGTSWLQGAVYGSIVTNRAVVSYQASGTSSHLLQFSFMYEIK